jgi:predicted lactoylglutathione lyase
MAKQIFINLAVKDLQKSIDFYTALGFSNMLLPIHYRLNEREISLFVVLTRKLENSYIINFR